MKDRTQIERRIAQMDEVRKRMAGLRATEADALVAAAIALVRDALAWTIGTHGAKRHDKTFSALAGDVKMAVDPQEVRS